MVGCGDRGSPTGSRLVFETLQGRGGDGQAATPPEASARPVASSVCVVPMSTGSLSGLFRLLQSVQKEEGTFTVREKP